MHHLHYLASFIAASMTPASVVLAAPSTQLEARAAGCGKTHLLAGVTTYHGRTSSGRDRSYSVYLPGGYDKSKPYPVVLGFHGSSSVGLFFEVDTKMKNHVYLNGVGGAWAGANYSDVSVDEDLQFVTDLLTELRDEYCVDDSRIYATGLTTPTQHSNGGGFVNAIACSPVGGEFAAFAPASGAYYTDSAGVTGGCAPARSPLPLLEVHGGSDKSVL
ncbi:hypothetical protein ANO14919_078180 [Xylariales sp. No.14919]|nr:hypothetical protein ANO14919_078180 [Xylariales sp. No.14919]